MKRKRQRNVRVREVLASANDFAHKYIVIPFILFGQLAVGAFWHSAFLVAVVILQFHYSNCPLTVLSTWLRQSDTKHSRQGFVQVLYRALGKWAVLPIAATLFGFAALVGSLAS